MIICRFEHLKAYWRAILWKEDPIVDVLLYYAQIEAEDYENFLEAQSIKQSRQVQFFIP